MEPSAPKVCLSIAGLDPSGGAGIVADIKTFSAFGCFPAAVVTSLTFQNTQGVYGAVNQDAASVRGQFDPIADDYKIAAVKTGMLPTREVISEVAALITQRGLRNFVVDPVVRSTSGYDLIDDEALRALIEHLFPLATLVTPNVPETERITGIELKTAEDVDRAARMIQSMGANNVLIKGGHALGEQGSTATDYLFAGAELRMLSAELIDSTATHGTGCVLSAAITANLALGKTLGEAVAIGKDFVTEGIRSAPTLGKGNSPVNVRLLCDRQD
jgi:hydroxymethylpyrimidine/phosphomethylpyrimidine kinase